MKILIFSLFGLLSALPSFSQLTMRIDSVDISYSTEMPITSTDIHVNPEAPPRIQIVTTMENRTNLVVWIYDLDLVGFGNMEFVYHGKRYTKPSPWICSTGWEPEDYKYLSDGDPFVDGPIIVRPNSSKIFIFRAYVPDPQERYKDRSWRRFPKECQLYQITPDWSWGKENPTDRDYLQWFKDILPSIKVSIPYNGTSTLHSEPIDLKKVVVTSNMTKEQLN